jgi:serine/threonine-protein kinase RsbW
MSTSDENWAWQCDQVIASDTVVGRRMLDELLGHLKSLRWSRHDIFSVHLAVDEALVNAHRHGNQLDPAKHIRFCCRASPKKVRVEITDEGPGFDPGKLPDPTDSAHLLRPCGRGVMLMRAFMSRVEFLNGGNHVVLEKELGA